MIDAKFTVRQRRSFDTKQRRVRLEACLDSTDTTASERACARSLLLILCFAYVVICNDSCNRTDDGRRCLAVLIGCVGTPHGPWLPVEERGRLRLPPSHMLARKELTCDCSVALLLMILLGPDRSVPVNKEGVPRRFLHGLLLGRSDACGLLLMCLWRRESLLGCHTMAMAASVGGFYVMPSLNTCISFSLPVFVSVRRGSPATYKGDAQTCSIHEGSSL